MTKNKRQCLALAVIATALLVRTFNERFNVLIYNDKQSQHFYLSCFAQVLYYLIPVLAILLGFYKPSELINELHIGHGFFKGLYLAFLFTIPMLAGYYLMGRYNTNYSILRNCTFAFKDAFREELFYRAFLFGQLFRTAKWGFLPAVAINGFIFGAAHLYQAHSIAQSAGVFAVTFAGAVWFTWLFIEWNGNLWLPVFLHFFMNLYWDLFSTEQSALGGLMLNLPRLLTIVLSVYVTIKLCQLNNRHLNLNRSNLIRQ